MFRCNQCSAATENSHEKKRGGTQGCVKMIVPSGMHFSLPNGTMPPSPPPVFVLIHTEPFFWGGGGEEEAWLLQWKAVSMHRSLLVEIPIFFHLMQLSRDDKVGHIFFQRQSAVLFTYLQNFL
ncbi:Hypothetical predicted protein [Podarcis lilfordi]|uniref:Uncharacterized protein n=1 Tax=Podarcis lilfordi TaxID=74358 RepID=A0AA35JQZ0_9SAUR|nr:Hypothetical predicted protein [Podarcis lilfordi]